VSAHDAVMALARDLVEEIAAGRALELAAGQVPGQPAAVPMPDPPKKDAAAVHPGLGSHLMALPGDTISGHAYAWLAPPVPLGPPPGQPGQQPPPG
jgi:hypothetical protein